MKELVYSNKVVENLIKKRFPSIIIADASDEIHHERFEVYGDNIIEDEFYKFAMEKGFIFACLGFNFRLSNDKEFGNRMVKISEQVKREEKCLK